MKFHSVLMLFLFLLLSNNILSQEKIKSFDFIILVDEEIWTSPATPTMTLHDVEGKLIDSFEVKYHAGNLSIKESDFQKLIDEKISHINLSLKYIKYCNEDIYYYNYDIDFKKDWFNNYFFVLSIYNTGIKKYRKIYEPLDGKTYTFEYNSSNGQMLRATKKKLKKECCN